MTKVKAYSYQMFGWMVYATLLILRVLLLLLVQPGYLHPDEFFQSVEIGAGDVYNLDVYRSWEFRTTNGGPLRSIAGIGPLVHLPLWISRRLLPPYSSEYNGTKVNLLSGKRLITRVLIPLRLQTFIYSLAVDIFILVACTHLRQPNNRAKWCFLSNSPPIALLLYSSATFGGLILAGRTLANTWEMSSVAVFGILFFILLHKRDNLLQVTIILSIQAVLSGWAIFLRCTYLVFVFPLAVTELVLVISRLRQRIILPGSFAVLALSLTVHACLHADTIYFTQSNPFTMQPVQNMVCIPCRFISYNSRVEHLSEHGLHPYYLHFLVNLPLMFGPVLGFWALWPSSSSPSIFSIHTLLWLSALFPLAFLSTVPHQEARFLLPIVPFILIMVGSKLEHSMYSLCSWKRKLCVWVLILWCVQQIVLATVYGRFHQAGVLAYLETISGQFPDSNRCPIHLFYHTYMPPRFPLGRFLTASRDLSAGEDLCNHILDLGGSSLTELRKALNDLRDKATGNPENFWTINLIYPGSLGSLNGTLSDYNGTVHSISGHLSFEDPPSLWPLWEDMYNGSLKALQTALEEIRNQLSINVVTLTLR